MNHRPRIVHFLLVAAVLAVTTAMTFPSAVRALVSPATAASRTAASTTRAANAASSSLLVRRVPFAAASSVAAGAGPTDPFQCRRRGGRRHLPTRPAGTALRLSSAATEGSGGPDTSVVGVCEEKIRKALETDDVKVTGI